jgi:hypothetical protein
MTRTELTRRAASALAAAEDRTAGRRLRIERAADGYRIGYQVPDYAAPWRPGMSPSGWLVLDWLDTGPGPDRRPWVGSAAEAAALAVELRDEIEAARGERS